MAAATKSLIKTPGMDVQFLIDNEDSGGTTTAFISRVGPGAATPPPHRHENWDETVYCTEGTLLFSVDGIERELRAGQALCIKRGQVHKFSNTTDEDAFMFVVSTPGLFEEEYFTSIAEIINAAGDGPPDRAALGAVMARHGVTPVVG